MLFLVLETFTLDFLTCRRRFGSFGSYFVAQAPVPLTQLFKSGSIVLVCFLLDFRFSEVFNEKFQTLK